MKKDLVSVIIPVYNAERFLVDTIETIKNQTYSNFEAIFVDDGSSDNSIKIIQKEAKKDKRIKLIKNKVNGGAALARNNGIDVASGRYLCFLDADDLWDKDKIEKQVSFMKKKRCAFSFHSYEFADENGVPNGKKVIVPEKLNYYQALKNTTIWTCTVMFDMKMLSKEDIFFPVVPSEDTACWWKILKKIDCAYGFNCVFSYYRRTMGTLSSNKFEAIKRIWYLYRTVEKLNFFFACYCFIGYAFRAVLRRI